jgi:predicted nucleic acid-binding Zn ribbon protein
VREKTMRKRGTQANLQKLGNILQGILKKHNINIDSEEQRLLETWNKAVGLQISAHTRPEKLKRNTLFVKVSSSVWMQQLHILKSDIIEKINQLLGKGLIKNVHFSIGEIPTTPSRNPYLSSFSPESYPLKDKEKKLIEKNTSSVTDHELKEILKRVMTKNIIRRRLSPDRKAP